MNFVRTGIALVALAAAFALCWPAFVSTGADQGSSASAGVCGWACKNLKQDWNYLFHPNRVNQCQPRGLETDKKREELSKEAFTRDDPLIPRYCGSPFTSPDSF